MAAFTSKASGNWSAAGQTTWNESGVPLLGDTATINSPHVVTVDVNFSVGDGSSTVLTIASGGELIVSDSRLLVVKGGIDNQGIITLGTDAALGTPDTVFSKLAPCNVLRPRLFRPGLAR